MRAFQLISFQTDFGWTGLVLDKFAIRRIKFGFQSELPLLHSFDEEFDVRKPKGKLELGWVRSLQKYTAGQKINLQDLPVNFDGFTKFQKTVLKNCQKIPYGETISYGQLAAKSKSPRAARAVGSIMKINRVPLVIPCHRVVASNGIGGYSASEGISVKRDLLEMEGVFH